MKVKTKKELEPTLTPEEIKVLYYWQNGDNMTTAYKKVMLSEEDAKTISEVALKKRVLRFFNTHRMRIAMANTPTRKGEKASENLKRWEDNQKSALIKRMHPHEVKVEKLQEEISKLENKPDKEGLKFTKSDREKWLDSLNIRENPTSMTIYGTGQFLAYMAVKEIMARQDEIKKQKISPLAKNGSVFTPTIISALKTAAAMVLPFAPAPTEEDRKEMSKAAVLLGLVPDNIKESPDDYTAPMPDTVEIG